MKGERISDTPVRTKAVLVDPVSMRISWMNESASVGFPDELLSDEAIPVDQIVPRLGDTPVSDFLQAVADSGTPTHLRGDVVTTGRGSLSMVTSVYPMPDGHLLVLTENTWLLDKDTASPRGRGRKR